MKQVFSTYLQGDAVTKQLDLPWQADLQLNVKSCLYPWGFSYKEAIAMTLILWQCNHVGKDVRKLKQNM